MKLIAQLDNSTVEIHCDTMLSISTVVRMWKEQGYLWNDQVVPNKIIPYHSVKFFTIEEN